MGPGKFRNVGKSQWVLMIIHAMISTRTRRPGIQTYGWFLLQSVLIVIHFPVISPVAGPVQVALQHSGVDTGAGLERDDALPRRHVSESTGAGGDHGIAKMENRREISASSYYDQSHYLPPHPHAQQGGATPSCMDPTDVSTDVSHPRCPCHHRPVVTSPGPRRRRS
jgi:hypothetical protein